MTKLGVFPLCPIRFGKVYDGRAKICCGYREITVEECVDCPTIFSNQKNIY